MFGLGRGIIESVGAGSGGGSGSGDTGSLPVSGGAYVAPVSSPGYVAPMTAPAYSAPATYSDGTAITSGGQIVALAPATTAGVAQATGVFGEGVYTPLDYPAMRFLGADQKLSDLNAQGIAAPPTIDLPSLLLLGGLAYLLLK